MFIGHFGVGLAAKRAAPWVSLGTWFLACQFLDLLWPIFLLLGWERVKVDPGNTVVTPLDFLHYPWSHSLAMACVWGFLFGSMHFARKRDLRAATLLGAVVVSHWVLDCLTHRPDLLLYPGGAQRVGLGLWNNLAGTLVAELALFILGLALYLKATRPVDKIGSRSLATLAAFLLIIHAGNLFGPPPPDDTRAIAGAGLAMWILVVWGYWVDRHRTPVSP